MGVALGVAVVVSIDLAIQASKTAFRVSTETVSGRATHQVLAGPGGIPDSVFTAIRVDLGIRESAPVVEGFARADEFPGVSMRVLGVDPLSEGPFRSFSSGGSGVDVSLALTQPGAVHLLEETARDAGLSTRDTIQARVSGTPVTFTVAGTIRAGDDAVRAGLRDVLVMDIAAAQVALDRVGVLDRIDLILPEGSVGNALVVQIRERIPRSATLELAGTRTAAMTGMLASFDLNLRALSLLAMVFGMFLIYNALNFSVIQRRELFGRMRTLGVERSQILSNVLREATGIAAVGTAIGLVMGLLLGRGLVRLVTRTINDLYFVVAVDGVAVEPWVLAKGAAIGLGATLLAAIPAARIASNAPPRLAQTRSVLEEGAKRFVPLAAWAGGGLLAIGGLVLLVSERSVLVSLGGLFLVMLGCALLTPAGMLIGLRIAFPVVKRLGGILGVLAIRSLRTSLSRTSPAVASLVVAVSVTVGLGIMIQSFRGTLVRWLDNTLQADVYVSLPSNVASRAAGTLSPDLIADFVAHPSVVGHSTYRGSTAAAPWGPLSLVALELDPRGERSFDFIQGQKAEAMAAFRAEGGVIVSEPLAFRYDLSVGSTVLLQTETGPRDFTVSGVFYDYGSDQGVLMMSRSTFDRYWTDSGVTSLGLFLADDTDVEVTTRELQARVQPEDLLLSVRSNRALRQGSLEVFDRTFEVTTVLRLLAVLVAFIGVMGALMALQLERGRELAVLRANGLTPGQVWRLVTSQTGLLGLISGLLAVPMGLLLAVIMIYVVNRRSFGWTLQLEVGPEVVLQAIAIALSGALLAGLYPAWKMSRTPPALGLREE
jgi:putative ABC transport system permease protein